MMTSKQYSDVGGRLVGYRKLKSEYPLLGREKELELIHDAKEGRKAAKDTLVYSNLRLAINIALGTSRNGILEDLVQEGAVSIIDAIYDFDESCGTRFSTHAFPKIRARIKKYARKHYMIKEYPVKIENDQEKDPEVIEETSESNPEDEGKDDKKKGHYVVHGFLARDENDLRMMERALAFDPRDEIVHRLYVAELTDMLTEELARLKHDDHFVLESRFFGGNGYGEKLTYAAIGKIIKMTGPGVRYSEKSILRRLGKAMRKRVPGLKSTR